MCVMIIDISRAYFYAPAQREIFIKLPPEDPRSGETGVCGKLLKSLYGTRDAGANWHKAYTDFLVSRGLKQCTSNPCHFVEPARGLKGLVHGDDFMFTGSRKELKWLEDCFRKQYSCKAEVIGRVPDLPKAAKFLIG